jgi:DNA-binding NarL/FixJ family response regulator
MNEPRNSAWSVAALDLPRLRADADDGVLVLIADADGLARGMMRFALRNSDRIVGVHAAKNGREALELARYFRPDVAIVDTVVPPRGGIELVRTLLLAVPDIRVLTVSVDDHPTAIAALRAGAVGHIEKDGDPARMADLVVRASDGEVIVPPALLPALVDALREVPDSGWRPLRSRLTTREWEIVELLGEGATTRRIADRLVLSPMTVYSHTNSILRKLGVNSRRDALIAAKRLRREEALTPRPT